MEKKYIVVFDDVILKQLKKLGKNQHLKRIISKMLDKLEFAGTYAGKLIDSKLHIYEIKSKNPPLRLYFKPNMDTREIYVFEFEMKKSSEKQKSTIEKLKEKSGEL